MSRRATLIDLLEWIDFLIDTPWDKVELIIKGAKNQVGIFKLA